MSEPATALNGLRVLSFGAFVAGNIAAKLLAELGADVVKIEARSRPEVLRTPAYAIGGTVTEPSGITNTVMFATLSRGTRNLGIDLDHPEARKTFHRLAAEADVIIENFAGSTLRRWQCSFEDLLPDNPRLVMLSLSGYGRNGPCAGYLAYASTIASYIGLSSAWDFTHGTLTDYITAATGAVAVTGAVAHARRTGEPVHLDVAQIDAMAPVMAKVFAGPLNPDEHVAARITQSSDSWFAGVFPTLGHDAWVAVDIEDGEDWAVLCRFLEREDLVASDPARAQVLAAELQEIVGGWLSKQTAFTAMHLLQRAGLAAGVVQSTEDVWRDPQLNTRQFQERVHQVDLGAVTYPRSAQRWTKTPGSIRVPPARLGEHTFEVLRQWIGLSEVHLRSLSSSGAIFDASAAEHLSGSDGSLR